MRAVAHVMCFEMVDACHRTPQFVSLVCYFRGKACLCFCLSALVCLHRSSLLYVCDVLQAPQ